MSRTAKGRKVPQPGGDARSRSGAVTLAPGAYPTGSAFYFGRDRKIVAARLDQARQAYSRNGQTPWEPDKPFEQLVVRDGKPKAVVVENVDLLAHASTSPDDFYRRLLATCNFHMLGGSAARADGPAATHFLLSGAALPAVFKNENLLRDRWELVDCDTDALQVRSAEPTEAGEDKDRAASAEPTELEEDQERAANALLASSAYYLAPDAKIVTPGEFDKFAENLHDSIVGQPEAVQRFVDAARLAAFSPRGPADQRPRAIFLLVGPSGVGKTEICRRLSKSLPGYGFTQINLAEFTTDSAVDKLIGLGRGYVDSEMGGLLTEPVRRNPRQVVLFDELDHAHSSVLQLFYKLFEGEVTDGRGRTVSFRECFVVLTTNCGVVENRGGPLEVHEAIEKRLVEQNPQFTPAFLGRVQSVIQFRDLDAGDFVQIAKQKLHDRFKHAFGTEQSPVLLQATQRPALLRTGWFSDEYLFCELFALLACQGTGQGARRLIRLLEEVLVHPVCLSRLKYPDPSGRPHAKIVINFDPFLPDLGRHHYEETGLLLIDDDPEEAKKLSDYLDRASGMAIYQADFDADAVARIIAAHSVSVVLLDLMKTGEADAGMTFLPRIASICEERPICLYSNLRDGPRLDELQTACWKHGVSDFLRKSAKADTTLRTHVQALVRRYYTLRKQGLRNAEPPEAIKRLDLVPPIDAKDALVFKLKTVT